MSFDEGKIDWRGIWADALRGVGEGLLTLDGSRAAQAALAGFDAFDRAQERRQRQQAFDSPQDAWALVERAYPELSAQQVAALLGLTDDERPDWRRERQDAGGIGPQQAPIGAPMIQRVKPLSANPYDAWTGGQNASLGTGGQLLRRSYRR